MLQRADKCGSKDCSVLNSDTARLQQLQEQLQDEYIFHAGTIFKEQAKPSIANEYLIYHRIPPDAIVETQPVDQARVLIHQSEKHLLRTVRRPRFLKSLPGCFSFDCLFMFASRYILVNIENLDHLRPTSVSQHVLI